LKQSQSSPLVVSDQVATIYTGINGYLDDIDIENVKPFLVGLREFLNSTKPNFKQIIDSTKTFTPEAESILKSAILEYKKSFS
jgi:F-type H+-transporting ATPase subunit alpha